MISKIGPLVQGTRSRTDLALHLLGGLLGGCALGIGIGLVGATLRTLLPDQTLLAGLTVFPAALTYAGLIDAGLWRLPAARIERQTPGWLPCAFGRRGGIFVWGLDLALVGTTRIPFQSLIPLTFIALASASLGGSILIMSAYGLARTLGVVAVIAGANSNYAAACSRISEKKHATSFIIGAFAIFLSLFILSNVHTIRFNL